MTHRHVLLAFVLVSAASRTALAQSPDPDSIAAAPDYQSMTRTLTTYIDREMRLKRIPALSIAVVDHGRTVWARGFGVARAKGTVPATANTVYRIGSVSKLFTDIGIMQLVERGELDLDTPVVKYIPTFHPKNPFGGEITLRELMSHRAGLVREPPVGNYFDPSDQVLAHMVASLNGTTLVYAPGARDKYSNAGVGTVGFVLETVKATPFPRYLKDAVIRPAGLVSSAFEPEPALKARLADGYMWTRQGTTFVAPTFQLGMAPAGSMYSTVHDMARFIQLLIGHGASASGKVVAPSTLQAMWKPQFGGRFGLGFALDSMGGKQLIGHGGAIYGFATELLVVPDDSIGVIVAGTKDGVNSVLNRIGRSALRMLQANRRGAATVAIPDSTMVVPDALGHALAGRYSNGRDTLTLTFRATSGSKNDGVPGLRRNVMFFTRTSSDVRLSLRVLKGDTLTIDDEFAFGGRLSRDGDGVTLGADHYERVLETKPPAATAAFAPLIGEYGWDHDILYIYEQDKSLHALIEWFTDYPLMQLDDSTFKFPDRGLYPGETMVFRKAASGRVTAVNAANVLFKRRPVGPEPGATQLKVKPLLPVATLRKQALAASPPKETGDFLPADLVEVVTLDPTIKLDVRYAGTNNFFGAKFYDEPRTFLQRPAAEAIVRVNKALKPLGYGLLLHDGYRPWYVTKMFWDGTPTPFRIFVADPATGSKHNRGSAIDLDLYDLATGKPIDEVGTYDEFSDRSFPDYPGGTSLQRWHRELLRSAMEAEGFRITETEWWHFDYGNWARYRIGNATFANLKQQAPAGGTH